MRAGDLVWLGVDGPRVKLDEFVPQYDGDELANGGDFPVKHVAVCTGTRDDGDHLLLHASSADGTNTLWPLRKFAGYDRYRRIYAIRRLRREFRRPAGASGGRAAAPVRPHLHRDAPGSGRPAAAAVH
jgi:hypothetical protein